MGFYRKNQEDHCQYTAMLYIVQLNLPVKYGTNIDFGICRNHKPSRVRFQVVGIKPLVWNGEM